MLGLKLNLACGMENTPQAWTLVAAVRTYILTKTKINITFYFYNNSSNSIPTFY